MRKLPQKHRLQSSKESDSRRIADPDSIIPATCVSREQSRRAGRKPIRKRRRARAEGVDASPHKNRSGSGSHDKGNSHGGGKQIKIAKDKYSLPRGGRRDQTHDQSSANYQGNLTQGAAVEKTLKLIGKSAKDKSATNIEERRRALEMMNETIRKNNLKHTGHSKDHKEHSSSQAGIHSANLTTNSIFKKLLFSGAATHHAEHPPHQGEAANVQSLPRPDKAAGQSSLASKVQNSLAGQDHHKRKSPLGSSLSPSAALQNGINLAAGDSKKDTKQSAAIQSSSLISKPADGQYHSNPVSSQHPSAVQYIHGLTAVNLPSSKNVAYTLQNNPGSANNGLSGDRGVSEDPKRPKKEGQSKKDPIMMKKSASNKPLAGFQAQGLLSNGVPPSTNLGNGEQSSTTGHHTPIEGQKNKASTLKLDKKPKVPAVKMPKSITKRLNRQRRSKSSNDLISENLFKQIMGRSDSVNSRQVNEDHLYEEWRKMVPQDSHSALIKEKYVRGTFRDQLQRAAQGLNPKTGQTLSPTAASQPKPTKAKQSKKEKHSAHQPPSKKPASSDGPKGSKNKQTNNHVEYFSGLSRLEAVTSARNKGGSLLSYVPPSSFQKDPDLERKNQHIASTLHKNFDIGVPNGSKLQPKLPIALFGGNQLLGQPLHQLTEGTKKPKRVASKKSQHNGTSANSHPKKSHSTKETQQQFYVGKVSGQPGRQSQGQSKDGTAVLSSDELKQSLGGNRVNIQAAVKKHEARESNPQAQQRELNSGPIQSNFQSSELNTDERELIDREILMPNNYNSDPQSEGGQRQLKMGLQLGSATGHKTSNPISITQNTPDIAGMASGNSRGKSSASLLHQLPPTLREGQTSVAEPSDKRSGGNQFDGNRSKPYETTGLHRKIRDSASSDEDNLYQTEGVVSSQAGPSGVRYSDRAGDLTQAQTDYLIQLLQNTAMLQSDGGDHFGGLLNELKRYQQGGEIDEEVKERLKGFLEKTQRGLTQILHSSAMSNQTGRLSDKTATPNKLLEQPKSSHKRHSANSKPEEAGWKKKHYLGIDLDDYEIEAEFDEADRRSSNQLPNQNTHQGRSFQWLRAEYEKNMEEIGKLLGSNRKDELKQLAELVKSNEEFSKLFDLRMEALNQRYLAQRSQIQRTGRSDEEAEELLVRLEEWHQDEQSLLEVEKKRITQVWLKSIDEVRKIKRDLEIATESRRIPGAMHDIYSAISRSLVSPSGGAFQRKIALGSPAASPGTQKSRLVSDPEVIPTRKRPEMWPKDEEPLGRSYEGIEPRITGSIDRSRSSLTDSARIEISENKKSLVREIDDGLRKAGKIPSLNASGHLAGALGRVIDLKGLGASPGPIAGPGSADSSALFAVSPTVGAGGSKLQSGHKPRSTAKSGEDQNQNQGPIWIKDQQDPSSFPKVPPNPAKNTSSSSIGGIPVNLTESGPLEFPAREAEFMQNKSLPPIIQKDGGLLLSQGPGLRREPRLESHSQPNGIGNSLESSNGLQSSGAVFGLESIRRELEKIPPRLDETQGSGRRDAGSKEATKKSALSKTGGNGDTDEYMMYDLIDGIGFDSGAINHEFEDSKKSPCELDDFASMSDSGREGVAAAAKHARRERILQEADSVADQILDSLFDEAARGIVEILESENQKIENEIQEEYDQRKPGIIQPYTGEGRYNVAWKGPAHPGGYIPGEGRRGIRVNYNAIREYLSFLVNFVKSKLAVTRRRPRYKKRHPFSVEQPPRPINS